MISVPPLRRTSRPNWAPARVGPRVEPEDDSKGTNRRGLKPHAVAAFEGEPGARLVGGRGLE